MTTLANSSNSNNNTTKKLPVLDAFAHITKLTNVVDLAFALINVESVTNNEYPMMLALKAWLEPRGWTVDTQEVNDDGKENSNRYNVIAYPQQTKMSDIRLLFNSHIDTVPAYYPASIDKQTNRLYGRGACDTKSLIAAQLLAGEQLKRKFAGIGFLYTVGEEVNHIGMKTSQKLYENMKNVKFMITGEPTESRTIVRQKGILIYRLLAKGKACHSGYPHMGINALSPIIDILHAIQTSEWPSDDILGETTVNVWIIKGGIAANVVPEDVEVKVMFRCAVDPGPIEARMSAIVQQFNGNLENNTAHITCEKLTSASTQEYFGVSKDFNPGVVSYGTDIPYFAGFKNKTCTAVLFGAGSITDAHSDHEFVNIDDLIKCVDTYQDIAGRLLNGNCDLQSHL